jgi:hypothetical protein
LFEIDLSINRICGDLDLVHHLSWSEGETNERELVAVYDGSPDMKHLPLLLS